MEAAKISNTLLKKGDHIFIINTYGVKMIITQDFSQKGKCDFYAAREEFLPLMYSIVCSRGHPLVPVLSKRIMRINEAGIFNQWENEVFRNYSFCSNPPTKVAIQTSLSIYNIMGMFLVLVFGLVLSLLVLGMELLYNYGATV
ncbi:glutamate receptor 2-like [Procambarus clarkii]|uniref:glutamate receptor 2-like n=1 Tax=Procambarus clarkii TaxID=6728 RepID=UPI003744360D